MNVRYRREQTSWTWCSPPATPPHRRAARRLRSRRCRTRGYIACTARDARRPVNEAPRSPNQFQLARAGFGFFVWVWLGWRRILDVWFARWFGFVCPFLVSQLFTVTGHVVYFSLRHYISLSVHPKRSLVPDFYFCYGLSFFLCLSDVSMCSCYILD